MQQYLAENDLELETLSDLFDIPSPRPPHVKASRFPSVPDFYFTEWQEQCEISYLKTAAAVLNSVIMLYREYFPFIDTSSLFVINNHPEHKEPMKVYDKNIIFLTASTSCWAQFIYQFAHEFCHYVIAKRVDKRMRWFEEALCELSSQFFLTKSAEKWKEQPPYSDSEWRRYASSIQDYVDSILNTAISFPILDLSNPSSDILKSLEKDEYQRELNCAFAVHLLPHFIESPSLWQIVYYLPELSDSNTFLENLYLLQDLSGQPIENIISSL